MDPTAGMPEPVARAWERSLANGRAATTRRRLLRSGALLTGGAALAACGIPPAEGSRGAAEADEPDYSRKEKVLNFSNWPLYVDVDPKNKQRRPTLRKFQQHSGVRVKYVEDVNDNNEFYGKVKPQLAAGEDTGRDLVVLTDWMAGRLIRQGWARRLEQSRLPHAITNLQARYRNPPHDPGRQYTYPWAGLAVVVAYNRKATRGRKVSSVSQLLQDDALKGRTTLLTEMRDTMGMVLLDTGARTESFSEAQYDKALARIQHAVDVKQLRRFSGNDYLDELNSGDIAACLGWAGDIVQLQLDNPDIEFTVPDAGYTFSTDDMLVPAHARHQANAEALMDFYYRPEIAAAFTASVNFICPVTGAQAKVAERDKELAEDPLLFPDARMVAKGHTFRTLSAAEESRCEEKFAKLIGA